MLLPVMINSTTLRQLFRCLTAKTVKSTLAGKQREQFTILHTSGHPDCMCCLPYCGATADCSDILLMDTIRLWFLVFCWPHSQTADFTKTISVSLQF